MAVLSTSANIATPGLPVGSIQAFAGANAPTGWLLCDGSAVRRGDYPDLYSTLGNTYGSGDGSTTFNLPDLRGRVPAGKDNMGGNTAGRLTAALFGSTPTNLGATGGNEANSHTHNVPWPIGVNSGSIRVLRPTYGVATGSVQFSQIVSTQSTNNMSVITDGIELYTGTTNTPSNTANVQPTLVVNYIIKAVADIARGGWYTQSSPPVVTQLPTNPAIGEEYYYINPTTGGYQHIKWTGSAWTTFNDSIFSPDSSGRTRRPYQPAFIAKTPAAYNHNSVVPASNVQLNVGNHYNNSTYRFTAPVAGIYVFIFHEIGQSNTSTYRYNLRKNGSQVTSETGYEVRIASYNNWGDGTGVWLQNAAVNDYFDVFYTSDGGFQSYGTLTYGFFGGYFLG